MKKFKFLEGNWELKKVETISYIISMAESILIKKRVITLLQ